MNESVLFLCWYRAPYGGNFIASMRRLSVSLRADGVRTAFVFPDTAQTRGWCAALTASGEDVRFLDERAGKPAQVRALLSLIDAVSATVLHVHFAGMDLSAFAALLRPKLRLVWHYHSDFSAGKRPSAARRAKRALAGLAEGLIGRRRIEKITVSEAQAQKDARYRYIPNALVPERCADACLGRAETRAQLGLSETQKLALVFAWSPYIKGADVAAAAVARLRAEGHTEFVLGLVGGRDCPPARIAAYLQEKTGLSGTEDWILHLPPEEDVFRYHKASDVMLSASRSEAFSYALLEALYTGTPGVSSDVPGVQWARRYETAEFFRSEDAADCARAILHASALSETAEGQAKLSDVSGRLLAEYGIDAWTAGVKRVLVPQKREELSC